MDRRALGRGAVLLAVILQASGQVAYGTWLTDIPSPLFVFATFLLTATFFLVVSGRGAKFPAWKPLILLNASTALTFLAFFYALKIIEPAIASALNVGVGPIFAVLIALMMTGTKPTTRRLVVCIGVLCGCAILAAAAARGTEEAASTVSTALLGVAASIATGAGAVLITVASKALLDRGWKSGAVLAHRFYLILPISLAFATTADLSAIEWSAALAMVLLAVAVIGVIAPMYLLQVGIRYSEPYTVMVTMAAMPLVSFAIQGLSPAYAWTWLTAIGLAVITAFIFLDLLEAKANRPKH
ncbi:DMT family transporter [Inquilinus sp. CAU 1745]